MAPSHTSLPTSIHPSLTVLYQLPNAHLLPLILSVLLPAFLSRDTSQFLFLGLFNWKAAENEDVRC